MLHTPAQQSLLYSFLNKAIDSPHLTLGVRSLLVGQSVNVKKSLTFLPDCDLSPDRALEVLWMYRKYADINNKYVDNTLSHLVSSPDEEDLIETLHTTFDLLRLPRKS